MSATSTPTATLFAASLERLNDNGTIDLLRQIAAAVDDQSRLLSDRLGDEASRMRREVQMLADELRAAAQQDRAALALLQQRLTVHLGGAAPPAAPPDLPAERRQVERVLAQVVTALSPGQALIHDFVDRLTPSSLYRLDASAGKAELVGRLGWPLVALCASGGRAYGVLAVGGRTQLAEVDPYTAQVRFIGELPGWIGGLCEHRGRLLGVGQGGVWEIDPATGRAQALAARGRWPELPGPVAVDKGGQAYVAVRSGEVVYLASLDLERRDTTILGAIGHGFLGGLAFLGDVLYAAPGDGRLIEVDPRTGRATRELPMAPVRAFSGLTRWP